MIYFLKEFILTSLYGFSVSSARESDWKFSLRLCVMVEGGRQDPGVCSFLFLLFLSHQQDDDWLGGGECPGEQAVSQVQGGERYLLLLPCSAGSPAASTAEVCQTTHQGGGGGGDHHGTHLQTLQSSQACLHTAPSWTLGRYNLWLEQRLQRSWRRRCGDWWRRGRSEKEISMKTSWLTPGLNWFLSQPQVTLYRSCDRSINCSHDRWIVLWWLESVDSWLACELSYYY